MQLLIINGQTFEILETIKSTPFDKEEKIVMHNGTSVLYDKIYRKCFDKNEGI